MPQSMAKQHLRAVLGQLTRKAALQKVSGACQICIQVFVSHNTGLLARLSASIVACHHHDDITEVPEKLTLKIP